MFKKKNEFYNLDRIKKMNASYNFIIGERSNGKTYAVLLEILKDYVKTGNQGAIIRRWDEDLRGKNGDEMYSSLVVNNEIAKLTSGKWNDVCYNSRRFYLCKWDDTLNKYIRDEEPFAFAFALSMSEHYKSVSFPKITNILFDEVITRLSYLPDEFVLFMNLLSTIIRHRDNVKIYMLANTVNKSCPYFSEMGLNHVKEQKQGSIELYTYGDSGLSVAVEYCSPLDKKVKTSDKYFAFDNPRLKMITDGVWEVDLYPHLERKFKPKDIAFIFFIIWEDEILQCEVVNLDCDRFIFIHRKTTPIKKSDDLIYDVNVHSSYNYNQRINNCRNKTEKAIWNLFVDNKIFYQSNEIGEIVRNYLQWVKNSR